MRSVAEDQQLFPPRVPLNTTRLEVGDGHDLYVEECGNPGGIPVVFLHGGPGAGISAVHRRLFDPDLFRVILFDQRGSGQSRPFGAITANTTQDLIADMDVIRAHFGIDHWVIFGGSWGSTLGLAYGITHPERCLGFVLRGIFLGTKAEVDWFLYDMGKFYPEAWDRFVHALPENERGDLLEHYFKRLTASSPSISIPAAESWSAYENSCATLRAEIRGGGGRMAVSLATLEAHYFRNNCFLEDGFILNNMDRIAHLPAVVVQGRHDVICPPVTASDLVKAWPDAELKMVDNAGHSALEPGILQELLSGLRRIAHKVS
ncbi:MAG: prolyl aminopeptidase [Alphaproteobacteria bacterium]|nr:prolyl aminopeptidase [Alphaproteobacteria bacterium]